MSSTKWNASLIFDCDFAEELVSLCKVMSSRRACFVNTLILRPFVYYFCKSLFILYVHEHDRLGSARDVNRGNSCI